MSIFDIAKYILDNSENMGSLRLQKLCYFSQAWSLVWNDEPLFEEDFKAYLSGPCCPELYEETRDIHPIKAYDIPFNKNTELTENQKETINRVLKHYKNYDDFTMNQESIVEGPWKGTKPLETITKKSMKEYYSSLR